MKIALTPDVEQDIQSKVSSGQYASASEVFLAGIKPLRDIKQTDQGRYPVLHDEVRIDIEAADCGELVDAETVLGQLMDEQITQVNHRLKTARAGVSSRRRGGTLWPIWSLGVSFLFWGSAIGLPASGHELTKQVSVDPDYEIEVQQNTQCSFITANQVNIRSGPGKNYRVVIQLNRGDGVRALYREGDWVKLAARVDGFEPNETYEPLEGWVHNQYINGCSEDQFDMWRTSKE